MTNKFTVLIAVLFVLSDERCIEMLMSRQPKQIKSQRNCSDTKLSGFKKIEYPDPIVQPFRKVA